MKSHGGRTYQATHQPDGIHENQKRRYYSCQGLDNAPSCEHVWSWFGSCVKLDVSLCAVTVPRDQLAVLYPKPVSVWLRSHAGLIDASCPPDETGRRRAKYKIELPGLRARTFALQHVALCSLLLSRHLHTEDAARFPILGDGKGDNQNTAIPFTRGTYVQCIDANQAGNTST